MGSKRPLVRCLPIDNVWDVKSCYNLLTSYLCPWKPATPFLHSLERECHFHSLMKARILFWTSSTSHLILSSTTSFISVQPLKLGSPLTIPNLPFSLERKSRPAQVKLRWTYPFEHHNVGKHPPPQPSLVPLNAGFFILPLACTVGDSRPIFAKLTYIRIWPCHPKLAISHIWLLQL